MQKTVVITGASTGLGFDFVRALLAADFQVVATVRKLEDQENLKKVYGEKLRTILLDVVNLGDVEKLPELLKSMGISELAGLINNAGVAMAGPFMHQDFSEVQYTMQVNVLSLMKVTQVLLPMLGARENAKSPGRIINISSVAGKSVVPFLTTYAASKHAVEGFSEGLRREMMLYGIKVIVIGPGTIKTPIWEKGFVSVKEKYNQTKFAKSFQKFIAIALNGASNGLETSEVSKCVVHAMTAKNPAFRYAPVPQKWVNWYLPKLIPEKIYDRLTAKLLDLIERP